METQRNIAVLLTCFNRKEKTIRCLNALKESRLSDSVMLRIFLVDDGSTDGTGLEIEKSFPDVTIIKGNGNLYWNRGMRLAWEVASKKSIFDYYIWLNDDVKLFPNAISELVEVSNNHPKAICSGIMCSKNNSKTTYGGFNKQRQLLNPNGSIQRIFIFHGNFVLIPKAVFEVLGNLDPIFHHAIGDFDYAMRAEEKGIEKFLTPSYSGYCEEHLTLPIWCLPNVNIKERFKGLYSPLGNSHPHYFFQYEKRHFGLITATKHFLSIHLRALIPQLWKSTT